MLLYNLQLAMVNHRGQIKQHPYQLSCPRSFPVGNVQFSFQIFTVLDDHRGPLWVV